MNSQDLDTRIAIDRVTVGKGSSGGKTKTWDHHVDLWAMRTDFSGNERRATTAAGGEVAVARVEFLVRLRDDLDETMRVRHKGKIFNIQHVKPLVAQPGWMVLTCDTGVNDG